MYLVFLFYYSEIRQNIDQPLDNWDILFWLANSSYVCIFIQNLLSVCLDIKLMIDDFQVLYEVAELLHKGWDKYMKVGVKGESNSKFSDSYCH